MRGCIDCKHHKSEGKWDNNNKFIMSHSCLNGFTDTMNNWWSDNGLKTAVSDFIAPDCAEQTDSSKMLQDMIDKTKELTELVKTLKP